MRLKEIVWWNSSRKEFLCTHGITITLNNGSKKILGEEFGTSTSIDFTNKNIVELNLCHRDGRIDGALFTDQDENCYRVGQHNRKSKYTKSLVLNENTHIIGGKTYSKFKIIEGFEFKLITLKS